MRFGWLRWRYRMTGFMTKRGILIVGNRYANDRVCRFYLTGLCGARWFIGVMTRDEYAGPPQTLQ